MRNTSVLLLLALASVGQLVAVEPCPAKSDTTPALHSTPAPLLARESDPLTPLVMDGAAVARYGARTGLLRRYYLRTPTPGTVVADPPEVVARRFLDSRAGLLGLDPDRIDHDLELRYEKPSLSGTHLRWDQTVGGVRVYGAQIVVKVSNRGEVSSVYSTVHPGLSVSTTPVVTGPEAIAIGLGALGPVGAALGSLVAELWVLDEAAGARLVYMVDLPLRQPHGDWRVAVDAASGDVVGIENRARYADGTGRVFDPDPETRLNDPNLPDNNDADGGIPFPGAYDTVTLRDITFNGSEYELTGPYATIIEWDAPVVPPVTSPTVDGFQFTRSASGFEDVMCYHHIDQNQRYIQSIGFTNVNNRVQEVDTHGFGGADNSAYFPSSKRLTFGEGGVDDAEDADVILHEYGHAIHDDIVPGFGTSQEARTLGESFGDYWAGSYSWSIDPNYQPTFVFNWDGHNSFWGGRLLIDSTKHYPEDCCGNPYNGLWCSALWNCLLEVGRDVMDILVLDHHFALGTGASISDAANGVIQSDVDLYQGVHLSDIIPIFEFWGFSIDPSPGVGVGDGTETRPAFLLAPSVPNPATGDGATIHFSLARSTRTTLSLFDVTGRLVRTVVDGTLPVGAHAARWDGRDTAGRPVSTGIYFYRLETGELSGTRKLVLLR